MKRDKNLIYLIYGDYNSDDIVVTIDTLYLSCVKSQTRKMNNNRSLLLFFTSGSLYIIFMHYYGTLEDVAEPQTWSYVHGKKFLEKQLRRVRNFHLDNVLGTLTHVAPGAVSHQTTVVADIHVKRI